MRGGEKRLLQVWLALILVASGLALAVAILLQNVWGVVIAIGVVAFDLYWFYVRFCQRKKPRYPLVPPEGKGDAFLPRTNIPRPIYEDAREMREKKRKLSKIRKMAKPKKK